MTETERKYYLLGQAVRMSLMAGMREQWETLFEGTVETVESTRFAYASFEMPSDVSFNSSTKYTIRATVDGETVVREDMLFSQIVGNSYLASEEGNVDTGGNFLFKFGTVLGVYDGTGRLYTREAGTHNVKIERMVS